MTYLSNNLYNLLTKEAFCVVCGQKLCTPRIPKDTDLGEPLPVREITCTKCKTINKVHSFVVTNYIVTENHLL